MEGLEVEWKKQAHRWWSQSLHYVHLIPPQQIYTAMAVLLFTTFLLLLVRLLKRPKANTILVTGLSGSRKTNGKVNPIHVIDVSGHSRLDDFLTEVAGIVFVVDAVEFLPNCRAASEYLYDILTKASVVRKKIPVLILCNKTNKVTAHSKEFILKQWEKEIDKLRASRSAISTADITSLHSEHLENDLHFHSVKTKLQLEKLLALVVKFPRWSNLSEIT